MKKKKKLLTLLLEGDGEMMKKMLVLMLVLGMASLANAELLISVDGVVDPPDTSVVLYPSDYVTIDIWGDGTDSPYETILYLLVQGPGSIAGYTMVYTGSIATYAEVEEVAALLEMTPEETMAIFGDFGYPGVTDLSYIELLDATATPPPLEGKLVDNIIFHCEALGDVTLTLLSGADMATVYDTQIIHQVPEPATIALLGLGGLFLHRRKKN